MRFTHLRARAVVAVLGSSAKVLALEPSFSRTVLNKKPKVSHSAVYQRVFVNAAVISKPIARSRSGTQARL